MKSKSIILLLAFASSNTVAFELTAPQQNDTKNLVWTGHLSPDTDSVTSAMLAAHIYGGTAAVSEPINLESKFVLDYCQADVPKQWYDFSQKDVGLVDFNQNTQLHQTVDESSIVAIVDHHAIGGSPVNMSQVAAIDIRQWGSAATILADRAEGLGIELPKPLACTTLAGILSDTVIFQSPTTTQYDRTHAEKLALLAGIKDMQAFGQQMLEAKSDLSHVSADEILTMDYKNFTYGGKKVGIGVAETLTAQQLLDRRDDFITSMKAYKKDNQLDYLFFSVTDTKNKRANLLWIDASDLAIAKVAFEGKSVDGWLVLDGVTSRKRQIGPAIQKAVENSK
ncbi:manganese-dependent inorganic pyrophosphatase [Photobacterium sp.]|uniref:manganese-dependent inorganic pyrophosphatase n=1 Tax=Photobacterium sp. TaxID=660 RepID=UPI00299D19B6|nr:manganese-dependent inorganic pyrophosphatase [Photobacterium sp.]MDX1304604.1 manganese-dependent inorganic pyrophosphatase [Photobacterium sp.]